MTAPVELVGEADAHRDVHRACNWPLGLCGRGAVETGMAKAGMADVENRASRAWRARTSEANLRSHQLMENTWRSLVRSCRSPRSAILNKPREHYMNIWQKQL